MQRGETGGEGFGIVDATAVRGTAHGMDVYVTSAMIDDQVEKLATTVRSLFRRDENPLYCPILNGGAFFYHDLARALAFEGDAHLHEVAYVHASRYGRATQGRDTVHVNWLGLESFEMSGRTIVVVDDILEEGRTVEAVADGLTARGAGRVITAFACRKVPVRTDFAPDFVLFDIPAGIWAVGYGMDLDNRYRGVRAILGAPPKDAEASE